ncbi:MAG: C4-type zinc ribbon domain-containing protein [Bifidobacteriaceae bacterium]|nr:C4-type zinc ribbon domain-containing protein [Bifidobacteriaceae bacterium]
MKAPAADQTKLLTVQAHDTVLHQLAHKRGHLPELALLAAVDQEEALTREEAELARAAAADVRRELTRVEDEIAKVEARDARDKERLDSGGGLSRELVALQQELETLARRRGILEEDALDVMERLEEAQGKVAALDASLAALAVRRAELDGVLASATGEIDQAAAAESAKRDALAHGLDAALMALYERLRARLGGVGAARLERGRCGGCGMQLSASDLAALRGLGADEVARCEECTRILVRGEDSGL